MRGSCYDVTTARRPKPSTLHHMGKAVLDARPEVDRISFSLPNKHHLLYDLQPFGLENPNEIFHVTMSPTG